MRHRSSASASAALLVLLLGAGVLASCSSDSDTTDDAAAAASDPASDASESGDPESGEPGTTPSADPNSPFVVAAGAVAVRSRDQVQQLHAMGVGTTTDGGLPQDQIPGLAKAITTELSAQIEAATAMTPPKKSPAANLVAALDSYRTLSRELAKWKPASKKPLPDSWFDSLQQTDDGWKESLGALSELSGDDLLADLPPLLMPA